MRFRHRLAVRTALVSLAAIQLAAPRAWATCGSANCFLVTGTEEGITPKGSGRADLTFRYIDQSRKLSGSDEVGEVLTPEIDFENRTIELDHHREIRTLNSLLQLDLAYGLSDRITVLAVLPLINERDHEHFVDVGTPEERFSGEDGTQGFGDVAVGIRAALLVKPIHLLVGGLALKLPTGVHDLLDGEGTINEPSIQPGTGSYDVLATLYYARQIPKHQMEAFALGSYRLNTENDLDYRMGDETVWGVGLSKAVSAKFTWSLQLNARHTARDEYLDGPVPSTGQTLFNLTPGVRFGGTTGVAAFGHLQIPVYQDVNDAQLAPRTALLLGISKTF